MSNKIKQTVAKQSVSNKEREDFYFVMINISLSSGYFYNLTIL